MATMRITRGLLHDLVEAWRLVGTVTRLTARYAWVEVTVDEAATLTLAAARRRTAMGRAR